MRTLLLLLLASPAWADHVHVASGVGFRHATDIDLARFAGETDYGSGNDASPGALSFRAALGYAVDELLEVWLDGRIGVGGLAIGDVEERYYGGQDNVGSSVSAELAGHVLFFKALDDWTLLLGPSANYHLMTAASGLGSAGIRSLGLGARGSARWATHRWSRGYGYIALDVDTYWHLTQRVFVTGDDHFDTDSDDGYLSYGVAVSYGWAFSVFN